MEKIYAVRYKAVIFCERKPTLVEERSDYHARYQKIWELKSADPIIEEKTIELFLTCQVGVLSTCILNIKEHIKNSTQEKISRIDVDILSIVPL